MTDHVCMIRYLDRDALSPACVEEILATQTWSEITADPGDPICRPGAVPLPEPTHLLVVGLLWFLLVARFSRRVRA